LTAGMQHFACAAGQEREGPATQLHGRSARGVLMRMMPAQDLCASRLRDRDAGTAWPQLRRAHLVSSCGRTLAMWGASAAGGVLVRARCGTPRWRSRERGMQHTAAGVARAAVPPAAAAAAAQRQHPLFWACGRRHVMATR
jgi:hypothetical protein